MTDSSDLISLCRFFIRSTSENSSSVSSVDDHEDSSDGGFASRKSSSRCTPSEVALSSLTVNVDGSHDRHGQVLAHPGQHLHLNNNYLAKAPTEVAASRMVVNERSFQRSRNNNSILKKSVALQTSGLAKCLPQRVKRIYL